MPVSSPVFVRGAEGQVVVLIADADGAVPGQPAHLFLRQKRVGAGPLDVLFEHPLVVVAVLALDAVQGFVQIIEQVGALRADGKEEIGSADLAHGHGELRIHKGVHGDVAVQLAPRHHRQRLVLAAGQLDQLRLNAVAPRPLPIEIGLYAALVDADPLSVQRGVVRRIDALVARRGEQVVFLRAHRQGRVQHLAGSLLGAGDVAHQVDVAVDQHLHQCRPAPGDAFVLPARIGGDLHLVFVAVPGPLPERVGGVEGGFIPADAHDLLLVVGVRGQRPEQQCDQYQAQREACAAPP